MRGGVSFVVGMGYVSVWYDVRMRNCEVYGFFGMERIFGDVYGGGGVDVEVETGGGGAFRETKSDGRGVGEIEYDEVGGGMMEMGVSVDFVKVEKGWG